MLVKADAHDPRTLARGIPGILDALFPKLTPAIVRHLNKRAVRCARCAAIDDAYLARSTLAKAMLFELAVAASEQLVEGGREDYELDWDMALRLAVSRQQKHFDAVLTTQLSTSDKEVAQAVAKNLFRALRILSTDGHGVRASPRIPGFEWISSGYGDFAIERQLIEVKCTRKLFNTADYRQVLMYWLLSYAAGVDGSSVEWRRCALVNPRLNALVDITFDELVSFSASGQTKVEILQTFRGMITDRSTKLLS